MCALCPGSVLDPLSHHALTCKQGGDVVSGHNNLQDIPAEVCHRAHWSVKGEAGSNLTFNHSHTCPADILVPNCTVCKQVSALLPSNPVYNTNFLIELE